MTQQRVADRVAERVVDQLEPVEIEKQHRAAFAVPRRIGQRPFEFLLEPAPVGQPREAVVIGLMLQRGGQGVAPERGGELVDDRVEEEDLALAEILSPADSPHEHGPEAAPVVPDRDAADRADAERTPRRAGARRFARIVGVAIDLARPRGDRGTSGRSSRPRTPAAAAAPSTGRPRCSSRTLAARGCRRGRRGRRSRDRARASRGGCGRRRRECRGGSLVPDRRCPNSLIAQVRRSSPRDASARREAGEGEGGEPREPFEQLDVAVQPFGAASGVRDQHRARSVRGRHRHGAERGAGRPVVTGRGVDAGVGDVDALAALAHAFGQACPGGHVAPADVSGTGRRAPGTRPSRRRATPPHRRRRCDGRRCRRCARTAVRPRTAGASARTTSSIATRCLARCSDVMTRPSSGS